MYGGREENETDSPSSCLQQGIFNDIHIYSMEKKLWSKMETSLKVENLFGMASCNAGGAMFVFGGSTHNRYTDATITMMWLGDNREDPWEAMQSSEGEICSSKKVSNKNIIII